MTTYPLQLNGIILSYTSSCTPTFRVFNSMEALERFVGRFTMNNHKSDDHWIDAVINGSVTVVDEAIRIEQDEEAPEVSEPRKHHGCEYGCTEHCLTEKPYEGGIER